MEKAIATADMKEATATANMKEAIANADMKEATATANMEKAIANTEKAIASTRRRKRSVLWESWSDSPVFNKHSLKWSRSSSSRILRVSRRLSSLFLLLLLLLHNPLPTWNHHQSHPLALNRSELPSSLSPVQCLLASSEANIVTLTALVRQSLRNLEIGVISRLQHQKHLLRLGTTPQFTMQTPPVREVHHQTAREAALRSRLRYQLHLLGGFGIELDDGSIPYQWSNASHLAPERRLLNRVMKKAVKRRLGITTPANNEHRVFTLRVGVAQPLNSRNTNHSVENAIAERQALTHIMEHHVSLHSILNIKRKTKKHLYGDVQHRGADIAANPMVTTI